MVFDLIMSWPELPSFPIGVGWWQIALVDKCTYLQCSVLNIAARRESLSVQGATAAKYIMQALLHKL